MAYPLAWIVWAVGLQVVPPPSVGSDAAAGLRAELRTIRAAEVTTLDGLARQAEAAGRATDAATIRGWIEPPTPPDGPERFVPLPEFVPAPDAAAETVADPPELAEARKVRAGTVGALMDLAHRAAEPAVGRFGLAIACLRAVLDRDADHDEARRLIGHVAYDGGWATPQAARNLEAGSVLHPTYGWVPADWVEHLERGELPGIAGEGRPVPWLPASEADALRRDFARRPWRISTEHFDIATNVPLAEAIAFGRRLEAVRDVFVSLFADVIGPDQLELDDRFRDPARWAEPATTRHEVWYFAERAEYVSFFKRLGRDESISLGYYMPATEARRFRLGPRSYFFRNEGDSLAGLPTLFHEASHQLLFELAGPSQYERNAGQYWIWEGLGTYFETFTPQADGSYQIGGRVGPRFAKARADMADDGGYTPVARLIALGPTEFQDPRSVYSHYAEAMALVAYLMHADGAAHRDAFLDYVADAYRGRFRPGGTAPGLPERLALSGDQLNESFRLFLNRGSAAADDEPPRRPRLTPGGNLRLPGTR